MCPSMPFNSSDSFETSIEQSSNRFPCFCQTLSIPTLILTLSSISSDSDISPWMSTITRILAESPLEEVEILQTLKDLDFSRQAVIKRLAVDCATLDTIQGLKATNLQELALMNIERAPATSLQSFDQVSRLTLSGDRQSLRQVDTSNMVGLKDMVTEVTSDANPHDVQEGPFARRAITTATLFANDTLNNITFDKYFCDFMQPDLTSLTLTVVSEAQNWFRIPECVLNATSLNIIICTNCQTPDFSLLISLPLQIIELTASRGTWTQFDSGKVPASSPYANFFDWSWIPMLPSLSRISFDNAFPNGTLPNEWKSPSLQTLIIRESPGLVGTISPDFFLNYHTLFIISLETTSLTGTIPNYGMENIVAFQMTNSMLSHWPALVSNATNTFGPMIKVQSITLSGNRIVELPLQTDFDLMTNLVSLNVKDNPTLSLGLPNLFYNRSVVLQVIDASGCSLNGSLPVLGIARDQSGVQGSVFSFSDNQFSGSIPISWAGIGLQSLDLRGNPGLSGLLLFSYGRDSVNAIGDAASIFLDGDGYTGTVFNLSNWASLQYLVAQTPNVDFCSVARLAPSKATVLYPNVSDLIGCDLTTTNASECAWAFPRVCKVGGWRGSPTTSNTSPTPLICPGNSPGPTFVCNNGQWVSSVSVTTTTITAPPATTVIVNGNLTTQSIVITSTSSTINVTGCVTSPDGTQPTVTLTLTQSDLETIVKNGGSLKSLLIEQSSGCSSLSTTPLVVDTSAIKSCKTIKTDKLGDARGLSVTFTVNTSKCNVWWIVLVSVLCALALIGVVVTVVVYHVLQSRKTSEGHEALKRAQ